MLSTTVRGAACAIDDVIRRRYGSHAEKSRREIGVSEATTTNSAAVLLDWLARLLSAATLRRRDHLRIVGWSAAQARDLGAVAETPLLKFQRMSPSAPSTSFDRRQRLVDPDGRHR